MSASAQQGMFVHLQWVSTVRKEVKILLKKLFDENFLVPQLCSLALLFGIIRDNSRERDMRILILLLLLFFSANASRRLVAIGDLHGDLNQTLAVLRLARIIDERKHWVGGNATLVQLGDVLDVGPDDIKIVRLLMKLTKEATVNGGSVEHLLGNHELRNLRGDFRAANPESLAATGGPAGRNKLLSMESPVGAYLRTRKGIFYHGKYLFMHGGFSTATSSMLTGIQKIDPFNAELRRALVSGEIGPMAAAALNLDESTIENVTNPILVRSILNVKCKTLQRVLDAKFPGVKSVVVGHVPHDPRTFDDWRVCGGRLIDIDFAMSRWKKGEEGNVAALEIFEENSTEVLLHERITLPRWQIDQDELVLLNGPGPSAVLHSSVVAFVLFASLGLLACAGLYAWSRGKSRRAPANDSPQAYGTF